MGMGSALGQVGQQAQASQSAPQPMGGKGGSFGPAAPQINQLLGRPSQPTSNPYVNPAAPYSTTTQADIMGGGNRPQVPFSRIMEQFPQQFPQQSPYQLPPGMGPFPFPQVRATPLQSPQVDQLREMQEKSQSIDQNSPRYDQMQNKMQDLQNKMRNQAMRKNVQNPYFAPRLMGTTPGQLAGLGAINPALFK